MIHVIPIKRKTCATNDKHVQQEASEQERGGGRPEG